MRLLNNAWAYVWRKKFKTLIIFLILLVMSTVSLSSLAVKRATDVASKETFKGISSSFSMEIDRRNNQGTNRGSGNLRGKDIAAIQGLDGISQVVKRMGIVADLVDKELVSQDGLPRIDADRQRRFGKAAMLTGTNDSSLDDRFSAETFKLVEGRHIKPEDKNVAMVHEEFAKKNGLKVGDTLKLKSNIYDADNEKQANETTEVTIVGTFSGKNKGGVTAIQELYQNNLLTDLGTTQKLYGYTDETAIYQDASFFVDGNHDLDKIMSEAKKLSINWRAYSLVKSSQNFPSLQKSIGLVYGMTDKLLLGSLIFSGVVLMLILFLWMNGRRKEMGIRLSLGMTKPQILAQFLVEVLMVSLASFVGAFLLGGPVSHWVGNTILGSVNQSIGQQLAAEAKNTTLGGGAAIDSFNKTLTELSVQVQAMDMVWVVALGLVVILVAVLLASITLMRKQPKSLLADHQ